MRADRFAWRRAGITLAAALALASCGGGSSSSTDSSTTAATAATTTTTTTTTATTSASTSLLPVVDSTKIPAAVTGWSSARIEATTDTITATDVGAFRLGCFYSHMNFDDAIVYPGVSNATHLHVYFGNTGVNASSTNDSIANSGNSTCSGGTLNRSAYWVPAMIDTTDGTPVTPSALLVYYKTGYGGVKPADVVAVPAGLRMVAGTSSATTESSSGVGRYSCVGGTLGVGWQTSIPTTCYQDNLLIMEVNFPQCWDGVNLDSPDHKSHMAYPTGTGCPSAYPVALPAISYEVYYDLAAVNLTRMAKWRLSSDNYAATSPGGYSAHGDYIFGWDKTTMQTFVTNCDNASADCHANLLGNGTMLY
jgi:hypothetical protein